jgi:hypothetical protein
MTNPRQIEEPLDLDDQFLESMAARGKGLNRIPYPTLLDLAIRGKDDAFKARVWEIVVQTGIDPDDPAFLMLVATGRLEVLLEDSPQEMETMFDQWQTQLYDRLQTYEKVAIKGHQKAIAQTVSALIRRTEFERAIHSVPSLIAAGVLLLVTAGLGGFLGIAGLSWYQASRPLDPAGPRQLTLEQAKALEWATSAEGLFASNLVNWNQDLLSRDRNGQLVCTNEVKRLGVTLEMLPNRKATAGFCTLWVQPPNQREFAPIQGN